MAVQLNEFSPLFILEEQGKLSDQEAGPVTEDTNQMFSEEQNHRGCVRSFMDWYHIPEFDSASS